VFSTYLYIVNDDKRYIWKRKKREKVFFIFGKNVYLYIVKIFEN
jgi:hypothetical protein